jgi:hypothetical protein
LRIGWALIGLVAMAGSASGSVILFEATTEFSGGTPPAGATPWLTATMDDGGTPGSVILTLAAANLTGSEFVSGWYLNLDPALDATDLVFSAPTKTGTFDSPTISLGTDAYKPDGDGKYDILFGFAVSGSGGGSHRFGVGDSVQYTVTGIGSLTADSFKFESAPAGGHGPFYTAAHVQSIGGGEDSGWVAATDAIVPEPATVAFVGLGAAGLLMRRLRRQKRG